MSCKTAQREHFSSLSVSTAKAEVRCHASLIVTIDTGARHKIFQIEFSERPQPRSSSINVLEDSLDESRRKSKPNEIMHQRNDSKPRGFLIGHAECQLKRARECTAKIVIDSHTPKKRCFEGLFFYRKIIKGRTPRPVTFGQSFPIPNHFFRRIVYFRRCSLFRRFHLILLSEGELYRIIILVLLRLILC